MMSVFLCVILRKMFVRRGVHRAVQPCQGATRRRLAPSRLWKGINPRRAEKQSANENGLRTPARVGGR